jgi:hypothetical protein
MLGRWTETPLLATVSEDPYTNRGTYHRTEVEPDSSAFASTVVSTFQVGRSYDCGASNLGWSVSTDAGANWTEGFLPGTTVNASPPGRWQRVTDPVVAYDAKHGTWLIQGMFRRSCDRRWSGVFLSRSTDDAQTFGEPAYRWRATPEESFDKNWIACDNTPTSPYYGNCYTAWSDFGSGVPRMRAFTSSDGGLTWTEAVAPKEPCAQGIQIVTQPNGNVVMPFGSDCDYQHHAFVSSDGGATFSGPFDIPTFDGRGVHVVDPSYLSVDVDAAGRVYAAWKDCQWRTTPERYCTHNDIALTTSDDGRTWSEMVRIPIDPIGSEVDHFLPALAVDPTTSADTAHIGILYYFHPEQHCDDKTCQLFAGFVSSIDGGSTWTSQDLAGPFKHRWFPLRFDGWFLGDYFSVSFAGGKAIPVFVAATKGRCVPRNKNSCNVWTASATIPL